jgi:Ice-binding-like
VSWTRGIFDRSEGIFLAALAAKPPEKGSTMKRTYFRLLGAFGGFAALLCGPVPALAQMAPPLGVAQQFAVLGHSGVTGSTGAGTVVDGDVGSSPTASISNFPPSSVMPPFVLHLSNDLTVQQAHTDAIAAYNFLAAQGPGTVLAAQLNGAVLTSGIYSFMGGAADLAAGGTLTLNGPGVFVFQVDSALTANILSNVTGTADPCSVFWRVGSSATLNGVSFRGIVIADASITVGSGSDLTGKALAGTGPTGAVTMAGAGGNTIGGCAAQVTGIPTLGLGGMAILIVLLAGAAVLVLSRLSSS